MIRYSFYFESVLEGVAAFMSWPGRITNVLGRLEP